MHGTLESEALRGALVALVERHAVLRTTYELGVRGFVQHVCASVDGDTLLREESVPSAAAAAAVGQADVARGFELFGADAAVLRCVLARVEGEECHLLLLHVHHVAFDGASTPMLLRELCPMHGACGKSRPRPRMPAAERPLRGSPPPQGCSDLLQRARSTHNGHVRRDPSCRPASALHA